MRPGGLNQNDQDGTQVPVRARIPADGSSQTVAITFSPRMNLHQLLLTAPLANSHCHIAFPLQQKRGGKINNK